MFNYSVGRIVIVSYRIVTTVPFTYTNQEDHTQQTTDIPGLKPFKNRIPQYLRDIRLPTIQTFSLFFKLLFQPSFFLFIFFLFICLIYPTHYMF